MEALERRIAPSASGAIAAPRTGGWWDHGWLVRLITLLGLGWGVVYLGWRVGWTSTGIEPALFVALFAAELFGWVSLAAYAYLAWWTPQIERPSRHQPWPSVDVLVCTYDEASSVVASTLIGCRAINEPHTTYLLDDGGRPEMADLAAQLGAVYIARTDHHHAKAGNINHALDLTHGELILMLDADHVPLPDILDATVGYFDDPEVALVQTPHDFSNRDSVQHTKLERNEQTLFYEVIAPGKDRDNAMFWCGSAAVVRRRALDSVGRVLTDTVAEDFHTTIAMHARGWRTRYHAEILVQGLAPHDLSAFLLQRARWARGNLGVLRTKQNPLTCRGLSMKQRASYLSSLLNYFSSVQRLTLAVVLIVTLATGRLPMHASALALAVLWLPWSLLAFLATLSLGRGTLGPLDSTRYGLMTMGINLRGVLSLVSSRAGRFRVTPKEGIDNGGLAVLHRLGLLTTVGVVLLGVWVLRVLAGAGVVSLNPLPLFAFGVVIALGVWEMACIAKVIVPLVRRRQRRIRYRTPVDMRARITGSTVRIDVRDVTPAGLGFESPIACRPFIQLAVETRIPDRDGGLHDVRMLVEVRSCRRARRPGEAVLFRIGGRFVDLDPATQERLIEFCDVVLSTEHIDGEPPAELDQTWLAWNLEAS